MKDILFQFGLQHTDFKVKAFGTGLINATWALEDAKGTKKYILQKVNSLVFKHPEDIAFNTQIIGDHLKKRSPGYLFVSPITTTTGQDLVKAADGFYRLFPFVDGSHSMDIVETPGQAYEAAKQFGRFTRLLSGFEACRLKITLPDFHNLSLRYQQFTNAIKTGNPERIEGAENVIALAIKLKGIVETYESCKTRLVVRCIHHDTKISNVLFDGEGQGMCVVDLDTVMPGYFISDLGDMMRTYVCPVSEEEEDTTKIEVRASFYEAIIHGYHSEMGEELTADEKKYVHFSGEFMIYMQALRFLTDHINDDVYYGAKYQMQNLVRAINQFSLLQAYQKLNPG